jgi:hypothetical protein
MSIGRLFFVVSSAVVKEKDIVTFSINPGIRTRQN